MSMISNMLAAAQGAMSQASQAPAPAPTPVQQQAMPNQHPQAPQNGTQPVAAPANPAAGSNAPAFQQAPASEPQPQSGLAQYNDLFNTTPVDPNAPRNGLDDPYLQFDEQQVMEGVRKRNFVPNDPQMQELAAKALGGDVAAFTEVLNSVAQSVFFNSAQSMARVSDVAAREGVRRLQTSLPDMMRTHNAQNTLAETAPALNNPGVQPIVSQVRDNFQRQNPTASPAAIAEMTQRYFNDIAQAMNPNVAQSSQPNAAPGVTTDFSKMFF